ncbi:glycosyltransferase family 2 protein [Polluticoccus soli]|uniref:glycosyltransferase family 2 protein n=1 Tax=Polluticoccus soli TaxID=3034150 RepID=UPI0023E28088|nr:glycosyltransferase family 2 protein [Flavipsychrobacter sp. JY13-12]
MLKIIVPLAGSSEQFANAGYMYPKPLIEITGKPMIQLVIEYAAISVPHQFIFIIKEEDSLRYHLDNTLRLLSPGCDIVKLKKNTKGGLCSVLMGIDKISADDSIVVINGDQVFSEDFNSIYDYWAENGADAGVVTFKSVHPRWSYARIEEGMVVQTAEKNPISNHAIAGYYFFARAEQFFECAYQAILNDVQHEGSYYISPVMNEYVLRNKRVLNYAIETDKYYSFYAPHLMQEFEKQASLI